MTISMMLPTIRKAVQYTLNGKYKSEVEDLIQEICMKVHLKMDKFDGSKGSIEAWVYRLSVNHVRDFFDKIKRNQWIELNETVTFIEEETGIDEIYFQETFNNVYDFIQTLDFEDRTIMLEYYLKGNRDKVISELTNIPSNQIPMYRQRIKKKIQKEFLEYKLCA
jgi:RNA polymerase sigma factor (sigma-70 family)